MPQGYGKPVQSTRPTPARLRQDLGYVPSRGMSDGDGGGGITSIGGPTSPVLSLTPIAPGTYLGNNTGGPTAGAIVDPLFNSVSAQFDFEGGSVTDESFSPQAVTSPNVVVGTAQAKYGIYGALFYTSASTAGTNYIGLTLAQTNFGVGDFTIEVWGYMTANPGRMVVFSQYDSAASLFQIMVWPTNFQVFVNSVSPVVNISVTIALNSWHQFVVTRSGTTLKMYLDGVLIGTYSSFLASYPTFAAAAKIGSETTTGNWGWVGYMDNFRITKAVRYTAAFTPSNDFGNTAVAPSPGVTQTPTATPNDLAVWIQQSGLPVPTSRGYLGIPQLIKNVNYTTVMVDSGCHLYHTAATTVTWTIPDNGSVPYPIGTVLWFVNESGAGVVTLAITTDTLRWTTLTGPRSLAANGTARALKVSATTWRLTGDGIT